MATTLILMSFPQCLTRVATSPAVKAALSQAEMGNFGALTIFDIATQLVP
jgi:hypothetical protein